MDPSVREELIEVGEPLDAADLGDEGRPGGGPAGRVVEQLAELREAELNEPDEALADPRLLGHLGHREAGGLTQLGSGERVARRVLQLVSPG
jgi:hypothetical protein